MTITPEPRRNPPVTADELARAYHAAYTAACDPRQPRWEGLAIDLRRNRVRTWQALLDAGWTFTPPKEQP